MRGIVCNWSSIQSLDWNSYDILAFSEVWAVKEFENLQVPGYEIKSIKLRQETRGGGVIIFGKKELKTETIDTPFIEGIIESTGIRVGNINIINVYRPPSGNKNEFIDQFINTMDSLRGGKVVMTGDFNINFRLENNILNNICGLYNLVVRLNGVTRVASESCIDNYITNIEGKYSISNISIADHLAIKAVIKLESGLKTVKITHQYRQMKEYNWLIFKNELHNLTVEGNNISDKWNDLSLKIKSVVEKSFPMKKSKHIHQFTMSQGLLKSRDKKNKLLRQYKRGQINKTVYINYNKVYRKLITAEKEKSFANKMADAGNNGKKKWKVLKEGLLLEKQSNRILEITNNNKLETNKNEIANCFTNHFRTCATKLAESLPPGQETVNIIPQGNIWSFQHTSEIGLVKIIKSLQTKNSCGPDLLSNRMLKMEPYIFARILKPLINECLDAGFFPECLKSATLIPIFKKGDSRNLNNYRPISLLPVMSKVFEKVINVQLTEVIEEGFIDDNQYGFRRGHSTEHAMIKFVDHVQKSLSGKNHVVSVFVDVSKAFDSCDHSILLSKIKRTGLDEIGTKLLASYLENRKNIVVVNDVIGGTFYINIGVGQGTILGPTLFKIYIMDMHLYTSLCTIKFADDSNFVGVGKTRDEVEARVNDELRKIAKWFADNRLTLHPDKSKFIIHSRDKLINLNLNNVPIKRVGNGLQEESVKMLGVEIDENLDFKHHVKAVTKKIGKGNYLLWRHGRKLSIAMKKVIYESFVRCHLLYSLIVWGATSKVILKPLEQTLARIWTKIGPRRMHTHNRLKEFKMLKLSDELAIQESRMVWEWENTKLPTGLCEIISERDDNLRGRRFNSSRHLKSNSINNRLANRARTVINDLPVCRLKKAIIKKIRSGIYNNFNLVCNRRNCFICTQ